MQWHYLLVCSLFVGLCSCNFTTPSLDKEQAIQADIAQLFTLNKQQLLKKRATLLQQIELLATARQGSYLPLIKESKSLLNIGHPTCHLLEMTQAELLQKANIPIAPDTLVPVAEQPYWKVYEAALVEEAVGQELLFGKSNLAVSIVEQWLHLSQKYEALLQSWQKQPTVVHPQSSPFVDLLDWPLHYREDSSESSKELAIEYFEALPLITVLTKLLQMETDILAQEVQLLNWLLKNISKTYLIQDKFTVVANSLTPVVYLGEPYRATMNLVAYPSQGAIEIRVNGETLSTQGGLANYKTIPTTAGKQDLEIEVWLNNPITKEQEQYRHTISYEVFPALE